MLIFTKIYFVHLGVLLCNSERDHFSAKFLFSSDFNHASFNSLTPIAGLMLASLRHNFCSMSSPIIESFPLNPLNSSMYLG